MKKSILSLFVLLLAASIFVFNGTAQKVGADETDTFEFKTVTSSNASSTAGYVIRGGRGTLGSITVGSSSAAAIRVYEGSATSTGTLIATLKASVAEQTFDFNIAVSRGIVLDVPANHNGVYTVTYR